VTTIIVLAVIAIAACVLHWWSARVNTSSEGPPPLFYSLDPSSTPTHVAEDDAPRTRVHRDAPQESHAHTHLHENHAPPAQVNGNGARQTPVNGTRPLETLANGNGNGAHAHTNGNGNGNDASHTPPAHLNGNGVPHPTERPVVRRASVESPRVSHRPVMPLDEEPDNAETVRFVRPANLDVAIQLLPGRLEVLEGPTPHREIRFMRVPGEPAQVILGREVRLTPHYIGLGSPTVSRQHARLDFADNQWVVKNLSRTNPVVVNDDELFDTDAARPLADGDRLELGDVVLRFHAH
jgi:hypothetical protein